MLKYILADIINELKARENSREEVLKTCISDRLDRSLELYEDNLLETCKYLLSKNPVTMIKGIAKEFKETVKEDDEDEL